MRAELIQLLKALQKENLDFFTDIFCTHRRKGRKKGPLCNKQARKQTPHKPMTKAAAVFKTRNDVDLNKGSENRVGKCNLFWK